MNQDRRADTGLDRLPGELVDWLAKPFASFLRIEAAGGAILLVVTIAALVLSNSPWAHQFLTFWALPVGIRIGSLCQCRTNYPQKRRSKFPQVTAWSIRGSPAGGLWAWAAGRAGAVPAAAG